MLTQILILCNAHWTRTIKQLSFQEKKLFLSLWIRIFMYFMTACILTWLYKNNYLQFCEISSIVLINSRWLFFLFFLILIFFSIWLIFGVDLDFTLTALKICPHEILNSNLTFWTLPLIVSFTVYCHFGLQQKSKDLSPSFWFGTWDLLSIINNHSSGNEWFPEKKSSLDYK